MSYLIKIIHIEIKITDLSTFKSGNETCRFVPDILSYPVSVIFHTSLFGLRGENMTDTKIILMGK